MQRGKIIILVAPSGGGKSTMAKRLLDDFDNLRFSVSATTRPPRKGEKNGVDYHFLSRKEFDRRAAEGAFLEWEEFYNGQRYGTLRSDVENHLNNGYFILLDIEVLGAENVKKMYGNEALAVFLSPPSLDILKARLEARGTESKEMITTRLQRAQKEMACADRFDKIVINDNLEQAYRELKEIISTFINS